MYEKMKLFVMHTCRDTEQFVGITGGWENFKLTKLGANASPHGLLISDKIKAEKVLFITIR